MLKLCVGLQSTPESCNGVIATEGFLLLPLSRGRYLLKLLTTFLILPPSSSHNAVVLLFSPKNRDYVAIQPTSRKDNYWRHVIQSLARESVNASLVVYHRLRHAWLEYNAAITTSIESEIPQQRVIRASLKFSTVAAAASATIRVSDCSSGRHPCSVCIKQRFSLPYCLDTELEENPLHA